MLSAMKALPVDYRGMPKARSYAPSRQQPAAPARAPAATKPASALPPLQMQAPAPQMMLGLQRLAGNRAAGVAVSGISTESVPKKPLRLQRLATRAEFKKQTDAGFLSGRGKTMKQ